jgi:hypothetical protein
MDGSPMSIRQLWSIKRGKSSVVTCIARAGCALYRSWFLGGKRTNLPYWDHRKKSVKLIGAVIDDREFFYYRGRRPVHQRRNDPAFPNPSGRIRRENHCVVGQRLVLQFSERA